ncbi:MAG: type II toxin-antitoxin system Phd/YefM family antitoxin [Thermoleophilaceae bacterium]
MIEVGVRDFKNGASGYLERVEAGEVITVTRRGKPVARVVPAQRSPAIARLVAEGKVSWSGAKPQLPRSRVSLSGPGPTTADYVSEGRR